MAQTRRDFIGLKGNSNKLITKISEFANKELPKSGARSSLGLDPITGNMSRQQVLHLLRRVMFAPTVADVNYFTGKSVATVVDELLNPAPSSLTPPPPLRNYVTEVDTKVPSRDVAYGTTWINSRISPDTSVTNDSLIRSTILNFQRFGYKNWWVGLMLNQDRSVLEKMVLFWHNHFSTETDVVPDPISLYNHNQLLRENSLGNYLTFVKKITIDPTMLFYLNNRLNTKTAPDENYARELQELFTVGHGSGYTEDDVKAAARVLTGHSIGANLLYNFNTTAHDTGNKQFSAYYNNTVITGKSGVAGANELDEMLSMIFTKDDAALYLVRKLYRFFVYYTIDAATETNVIVPLANLFKSGGWQIKPVLKKLFESEHFYDVVSQGCNIKNPIDFVVSAIRMLNCTYSATPTVEQLYNIWNSIRTQMSLMQMDPGDPPSVAGWQAYYQTPQFYEMWINSDTYQKRTSFLDTLQNAGFSSQGVGIKPDILSFVANNVSDPSDPNKIVSEMAALMLGISISPAHLDTIKKDHLLTGQTTDAYWTTAWTAYISNPTNTTNKNTVLNRLKTMLNYLLKLEEYQLS